MVFMSCTVLLRRVEQQSDQLREREHKTVGFSQGFSSTQKWKLNKKKVLGFSERVFEFYQFMTFIFKFDFAKSFPLIK